MKLEKKSRGLEKEIKQLSKSRELRSGKLDDYNKIAQNIELTTNPSKETFAENREKAKALKQSTQQKIEEESENLRLLKNKADDFEKSTNELVKTIQTLQKNKKQHCRSGS